MATFQGMSKHAQALALADAQAKAEAEAKPHKARGSTAYDKQALRLATLMRDRNLSLAEAESVVAVADMLAERKRAQVAATVATFPTLETEKAAVLAETWESLPKGERMRSACALFSISWPEASALASAVHAYRKTGIMRMRAETSAKVLAALSL